MRLERNGEDDFKTAVVNRFSLESLGSRTNPPSSSGSSSVEFVSGNSSPREQQDSTQDNEINTNDQESGSSKQNQQQESRSDAKALENGVNDTKDNTEMGAEKTGTDEAESQVKSDDQGDEPDGKHQHEDDDSSDQSE